MESGFLLAPDAGVVDIFCGDISFQPWQGKSGFRRIMCLNKRLEGADVNVEKTFHA
jgi:hypothetical protein